MPHPITDTPKTFSDGSVALWGRVPLELREAVVGISRRRKEPINVILNKALSQYVASDARKHK